MDWDVKKTSLRSKKDMIILIVVIATNNFFDSFHEGKTFKISHRPCNFFRSPTGARHPTNSCFLNVIKARKVLFTENLTFCFVFGLIIARRLRL